MTVVGILLHACTRQAPPQILYKRLGGERAFVAIALQVSREPEIEKMLIPETARIFRQRLAEWLCHEASGPCNYPTRKEFFDEMEFTTEQQQMLLKSLQEVMTQLKFDDPSKEELLFRLNGTQA